MSSNAKVRKCFKEIGEKFFDRKGQTYYEAMFMEGVVLQNIGMLLSNKLHRIDMKRNRLPRQDRYDYNRLFSCQKCREPSVVVRYNKYLYVYYHCKKIK